MHPDRLEPELFGVEPGLLEADGIGKIGTFEKAHGGSLFLDEVADMPMETQCTIVRVLREQPFQRVGGNTRVPVDLRVIAPTSRSPTGPIAGGRVTRDRFTRPRRRPPR